MTQICSCCKIEKDISEFGFRLNRGYYKKQCRECLNEKEKLRYLKNPEKEREYDRNYFHTKKYQKWRKQHRLKPDIKAKERLQVIKYRSKPDSKAKRTEYLNKPEVRERNRYLQRKRLKRILRIG